MSSALWTPLGTGSLIPSLTIEMESCIENLISLNLSERVPGNSTLCPLRKPSDFLLWPEIFEIILCNGQLVFYAPLYWGKKWPKNNKILRTVIKSYASFLIIIELLPLLLSMFKFPLSWWTHWSHDSLGPASLVARDFLQWSWLWYYVYSIYIVGAVTLSGALWLGSACRFD